MVQPSGCVCTSPASFCGVCGPPTHRCASESHNHIFGLKTPKNGCFSDITVEIMIPLKSVGRGVGVGATCLVHYDVIRIGENARGTAAHPTCDGVALRGGLGWNNQE